MWSIGPLSYLVKLPHVDSSSRSKTGSTYPNRITSIKSQVYVEIMILSSFRGLLQINGYAAWVCGNFLGQKELAKSRRNLQSLAAELRQRPASTNQIQEVVGSRSKLLAEIRMIGVYNEVSRMNEAFSNLGGLSQKVFST